MKIDVRNLIDAYKRLYYDQSRDKKLLFLLSVKDDEVIFTGEIRDVGFYYSPEDMKRNGDFKLIMSPDGEVKILGAEYDLTQADKDLLYEVMDVCMQ